MLAGRQAATLTRRFQEQVAAIGRRGTETTTAVFASLGSYDDVDVDRFVQRVGPTMVATRRAAVTVAAGYFAVLLQVRPPGVRYDEVDVPDETLEPFIAMRRALGVGRSFEAAVLAGVGRTEAITRNLAVSSARRTGDVVVARSGQRVTGWQRVPDGGACEWCQDLAMYTWPTAEAADFGHDRCGCSPIMIVD